MANDVYAFGVVLIEVLTGKPAVFFPQGKKGQLLSAYFIRTMKYTSSLMDPSTLDPRIKDWPQDNFRSLAQIARCCIEDQKNRPGIEKVHHNLRLLLTKEHRVCMVCHDNPSNAKLQCGHSVLCSVCADHIRRKGNSLCPICRQKITAVIPGVYSTSFEA